jgi:glycine oxidase
VRPAVRLADGTRVEAGVVVIAAGAWTKLLRADAPPVRPVKGQMLSVRSEPPFDLRHVVRGPQAYVVPKSDGRVVIGATAEEMGFDTRVTAGGLHRLLEGAWEIVPGIAELEVEETWAGLRPASRDHRPAVGFADAPGIVYATGHYRHGILLAPVTAEEVAAEVSSYLDGHLETSRWLAPFSPRRFSGAPART